LSTIIEEAKCERCQIHDPKSTDKGHDLKTQIVEEPPIKRQKICDLTSPTSELLPAFYYNVHRRKLKGINIPK